METKIFDWKENINDEELKIVKDTLNNGGVIVFPTDTVYGVGCNCFDCDAIKRIYNLKERPDKKPINVLTNSLDKMKMVASNISLEEEKLINKYMPGALTIIFDKKENVPDILTSGLNTVGVRIPNNNIALKILDSVDYPVATTSANISGMPAGVKIDDFLKEFIGYVDIIIDGGESNLKVASTIVRVDDKNIKIIREGSLKIN